MRREELAAIFEIVLELYQPKITKPKFYDIRERLVTALKRLASHLEADGLFEDLKQEREDLDL